VAAVDGPPCDAAQPARASAARTAVKRREASGVMFMIVLPFVDKRGRPASVPTGRGSNQARFVNRRTDVK
jgi:hypothetical protein